MHLKVGQDGKAVLPNTMDMLTCMDGKGRFYVNRPISNNLEYTATVEGVNFLARKTLQHFWLAKALPLLLLPFLDFQAFPGEKCCSFSEEHKS